MTIRSALVVFAIVLFSAGMAAGQTEWIDHPDNPVIGADDPGLWAPGGAWVSAVVYDGTTYHMWFDGVRVEPGGWITGEAVGHATSPDGIAWAMDPANPVITAGDPGEWDDEAAGGGPVIYDGVQFKMWYAGWAEGGSNVGYATSPDGSTWTKYSGNPVMEHGTPGCSWYDTWLQPTTVLVEDGTYRMWFHGRTEDYYTGQIGYAESPDGITWSKWPDPVLEPADYPGSVEASFLYPSVVFDGTTYHMWHANDAPDSFVDVHYAYSADGIEWTKHRGNPVHELADETIFTLSVLPDGDTWQMWYTHWGSARLSQISYATSDCCGGVAAFDSWQFISAAALASGAEGSFYRTDVDVSNADGQTADFQFMWFPRGVDNSEHATSETFTLGAGKSARYSNVLAEVFDLEPDSFGAIGIRSTSPELLAMSRTYNLGDDGAEGTYGQAMPAVRPEGFIQYGERRRILFGSENADLRTNIGCQNGTDAMTVVYLDLYNAAGTSLGRKTMMLRAFGNDQVNRIFDGHNPVNGYVNVSPAQAGNLVYCYGSVLDNVTSDPTTIPPQ